MKTSKVSDPEKWPSAFDVLHFASPEDAAKAQALLYEMAAEMVTLRSKVKPELVSALQPCECAQFCKKLEGLPEGQFCVSIAMQDKQQFAAKAAGHGPTFDPQDYFRHETPCPCTQLPHTCGAPVPTTGQEELARQIYGMAHRRINRRHKVAQIADYLREIMANCSKASASAPESDKDYVISGRTMHPRSKRGL